MRILALSTWWPEPADNGSRMRIMQLLRQLAARHELHLIAFTQDPPAETRRDELSALCASVAAIERPRGQIRFVDRLASLAVSEPASVRVTWSREMAQAVAAAGARLRPDVVVAFQIDMAPYARLLEGAPRILEELEVSFLLEHYRQHRDPRRRLRYLLTALQHRRYVSSLLRAFAAVTVVSRHEAELVGRLARGRSPEVAIIPNGADVEGCRAYRYDPEPDTMIYPGALSYDANLDAARHFLGAIMPLILRERPAARLRITGRSTPEQRAALPPSPGVEHTGYVDDVRALIARSAVEVVPLRQGGGTRLKILEALALGTPVVSTAKGAEGLDLVGGRDLVIADSPEEFAAATVELLARPELRARLSAVGRLAVAAQYDWRAIGGRLVALVEAVASEREPAYAADTA